MTVNCKITIAISAFSVSFIDLFICCTAAFSKALPIVAPWIACIMNCSLGA